MAANIRPSELPAKHTLFVSFLWGCVLGVFAASGVEIFRMVFDHNQHTVMSGLVYRSAQRTPEDLKKVLIEKQIRTLINLRGRPISDWYPKECVATQEVSVSQEDITTSANRLPSPNEIRRLIEVFDRAEYPILLHCQQGADRTGLASTAWQLLYTDATYDSARRQCSPRYGHFRAMTTANMDLFFDMYEQWLSVNTQTHTPKRFREWATTHYKPGHAWAKLQLKTTPKEIPYQSAIILRLTATNLSDEPWDFQAGTLLGVHARFWVREENGQAVHFGQSGFLNSKINPGESIELPIPLPPMTKPGRYRLLVDLSRRNIDFFQFGSEPLTHEWNAIDSAKPVK